MDLAGRYLLSRDGNRYGPYTRDQLFDFLRQGRVVRSDWVWGDGMTDWVPLSQVLELPPEPPVEAEAEGPASPADAADRAGHSAGRQPFGAAPASDTQSGAVPPPPGLHWGIVLLITLVTFGLFSMVWMIVQAAWVRRVDPKSRALPLLAVGLPVVFVAAVVAELVEGDPGRMIGLLARLLNVGVVITAYFSMLRSLEDYFTTREPIDLKLSPIMTFFFNMLYFQYHFTRIARWKTTGVLD